MANSSDTLIGGCIALATSSYRFTQRLAHPAVGAFIQKSHPTIASTGDISWSFSRNIGRWVKYSPSSEELQQHQVPPATSRASTPHSCDPTCVGAVDRIRPLCTGPARTIGLRNAYQICETWRTSVLSDAICTVTRARLIKYVA